MFKWIEKKDLIYWLLFVLMIWLLTSNYDVTLSKWSFAGTIISIILAVIAIIYSFDQSSTTLYSTRKLEESSNKIEKVTKLLETTSINDLFSKLETRIESLNQSFDENIKNNLSIYQKNIEDILEKNLTHNIGNDIQILTEVEWKNFIKDSLKDKFNNTGVTTLILIYSYLSFKKNKNLNFKALANLVNSSLTHQSDVIGEKFVKNLEGLFDGCFLAFAGLNVFSVKASDFKKITATSSTFTAAMESLLSELPENNLIKALSEFIEKSH